MPWCSSGQPATWRTRRSSRHPIDGETRPASEFPVIGVVGAKLAVRLLVNSWRWQGTPFYLRAGKNLPVNCTEVVVRLRRPPSLFPLGTVPSNYFRFRIGPDMTIGIGATAMDPAESMCGREVELQVKHHPTADEMDAYEGLLGDAMASTCALATPSGGRNGDSMNSSAEAMTR